MGKVGFVSGLQEINQIRSRKKADHKRTTTIRIMMISRTTVVMLMVVKMPVVMMIIILFLNRFKSPHGYMFGILSQ